MRVVDMHEAETHLSKLVDAAAKGEPFIVARAGKPLVTVAAVAEEEAAPSRLGFLRGQFNVPDDFDEMGREEIEAMFYDE